MVTQLDQRLQDLYKAYPYLKKTPLQLVQGTTTKPYQMEFFQGTDKTPAKIEIYNPNVTLDDLAGEVVSHQLVNTDSFLGHVYSKFKDSLTKDQMNRLQEQYQWAQNKEGETRPFEVWKTLTGLPAYFRGYLFNQWPDEFNKKAYTPDQIDLFNNTRQYLQAPAE
jgi:hypothetical protein